MGANGQVPQAVLLTSVMCRKRARCVIAATLDRLVCSAAASVFSAGLWPSKCARKREVGGGKNQLQRQFSSSVQDSAADHQQSFVFLDRQV